MPYTERLQPFGVAAMSLTAASATAPVYKRTYVKGDVGLTLTRVLLRISTAPTVTAAVVKVTQGVPTNVIGTATLPIGTPIGAVVEVACTPTDFVSNFPVTQWTVATAIAAGGYVRPTSANTNGLVFQATAAGTTHASTEPTWPTTVGGTVTDNGITWTAVNDTGMLGILVTTAATAGACDVSFDGGIIPQ